MSNKFDCLITEATRSYTRLKFGFELLHEADQGRMLAQIGNELSKRKIRCTVAIGEAKPDTTMVLDRWSEGPLTYCLPEDVEKLEAMNAELLEAAINVAQWWDSDNKISPKASGVIDRLRAAIANAKGEGV